MTELLNSKFADTAPALIGVIAILMILIPFVYRLSQRQERIMDRQADAVTGLAGAIDRMKTEDDSRRDRHYQVLHGLAEQCNRSHVAHDAALVRHDEKLDRILDGHRRIEDTLMGKVRGGR